MSRIASVFLNSGMFPAVPHASEVGENGEVSQEYWSRLFKNDGAKASDSLAAVYGCVNVISSSISAMPLQLFRKGPGGREREANHPVAKLLATRPNEAMTWTQLRESIIYNTVLRGNSYARTFWRGGYPVEIFPVPTASVTPKPSYLTGNFLGGGGQIERLQFWELSGDLSPSKTQHSSEWRKRLQNLSKTPASFAK